MTPCYPSVEQPTCRNCSRMRTGDVPAKRRDLVMDASITARRGVCAFFDLRLPARVAAARARAFKEAA
jgi:hypothetical protein